MFSDGEAKRADLSTESVVFGMRVGEQISVLRVELAAAVKQVVRDLDGDDLRQKHVMRSKRNGFDDLAFDVERAVTDDGAFDLRGGQRREPRFREFIDVTAGFHAAPVCDFRLRGHGNVDDEFLRAADDFMGVAFLADGYRQHGGIRTDRSGPCDRDDVRSIGRFPAAA